MYFSLIIVFLFVVTILVAGVQNSMPLQFKFLTWKFNLSVTALIFYSSILGAAALAVLTLPALAKKHFQLRTLRKNVRGLTNQTAKLKENGLSDSKGE